MNQQSEKQFVAIPLGPKDQRAEEFIVEEAIG
jgi:hypothetical protein